MNGKVRCAHILQKHKGSRNPNDSFRNKPFTRTIEEALSNIQKFRETIVSGKGDFSELALQYSECRSAGQGGDLGFFGRNEMQQAFEDVSFALNKGELSEPVETDSGIHIILRIE